METPTPPATTPKRTPGTGGVIDLWKNNDDTPSKRATGRWKEGLGKPQGIGKRWRGWCVGDDRQPYAKTFRTEAEAEGWVSTERGKVVTNQWVAPTVGVEAITYGDLSSWLSGLSVDGSQAGTGLSASRIIQTHQLMGAVFKYAVKAGLATKNIAAEIERRHDLPENGVTHQRYLTHAQLLGLAREAGRFETMTLVLSYCGLRFGEAAALRRGDVRDREITARASATYVARQGILETGTKTKRTRQVPVAEPVWDRLKGELPAESDALVFLARKGGQPSNDEYRRAFDKAVRASRLTLRRSARRKLTRPAKL